MAIKEIFFALFCAFFKRFYFSAFWVNKTSQDTARVDSDNHSASFSYLVKRKKIKATQRDRTESSLGWPKNPVSIEKVIYKHSPVITTQFSTEISGSPQQTRTSTACNIVSKFVQLQLNSNNETGLQALHKNRHYCGREFFPMSIVFQFETMPKKCAIRMKVKRVYSLL